MKINALTERDTVPKAVSHREPPGPLDGGRRLPAIIKASGVWAIS